MGIERGNGGLSLKGNFGRRRREWFTCFGGSGKVVQNGFWTRKEMRMLLSRPGQAVNGTCASRVLYRICM